MLRASVRQMRQTGRRASSAFFVGLVAVPAILVGLAGQSDAAEAAADARRDLLDTYCVACHNERLKTAGLTLESDAVDATDVSAHAEVWEKVLRKVRSGQMPPEGRRRPDVDTAAQFSRDLVSALDDAANAAPNPGRPAVHRLNRTEYVNAIRDLLDLEIDGRALLPADDSGFGFDNNADVLTISPALLDRYMAAATKIGRLAIGDPALRPTIATYDIPRRVRQNQRMSELLPFGTRGGIAVRHTFPLDGEYLLKIRLGRVGEYGIAGLDRGDQIEIRLDREQLKVFTVGGDEELMGLTYDSQEPIPPDRPDLMRRKIYENSADEGLEFRLPVKAGTRLVGVAFVKYSGVAEEGGRRGGPSVGALEILGPYEATAPEVTASRDRIFTCRPQTSEEEASCAREILSTLARRAFRRPITEADVDTLIGFYEAGRLEGTFDQGIQMALERVLVDPEFLFRIERDPDQLAVGTVYPLSDTELASRLSFFLWSSIPDDELLDAAERGGLREPATLERQVLRMLADPRASEMANNFASQWLLVRNVRFAEPDRALFPRFDGNLKDAMARETELFFEDQFRHDRSVMDLLRADYTFVNSRLAEHYGIPNVYGSHFRRVTLEDERRHGLLGHGSVLTVTSYPNRTSVVLRGKWVLENLLGAPPPPPPPNIPALEENVSGEKPKSLRERMEQHRGNPVCASCHARIDPLGFALENFDAVGRWRDMEGDIPVDASASLPDGTTIDGPVEFRMALAERHEEFAGNFIEKLMTYSVGRGLEYYDQPAVREIVRETAATEYRWSDIVLGIVKSVPFQMRRVPES